MTARALAFHPDLKPRLAVVRVVRPPEKLDFENLVPRELRPETADAVRRPGGDRAATASVSPTNGVAAGRLRGAYCIICHRDKDSCSKGFH